MNWKQLMVLTIVWRSVSAIIGYDCGTKSLNMTTISLIDIDECDVDIEHIESSQIPVFLLQTNEYNHVDVLQCKIEISRTVHYCGKLTSHVSIVNNAYMDYIFPITREACQIAHDHGTLRIGNAIMDGLIPNTTTIRSITLAGSSTTDAACSGAQYSDAYGSWDQVVVMGTARITLRTMTARSKVDDNKIYLLANFPCTLSSGYCIDPEGGHSFWNPLPRGFSCPDNVFSLLYKGLATKLKSKTETIYTVSVLDTSFSLSKVGVVNSCGLTIFKTEHPKLFIMEGKDLGTLGKNNAVRIKPDNMDMFLYVNAKFIYVERHIRSQMQSLYEDVVKHRCKLEKEVLKNSLAIASILPDEFAYRFMKGPGYMAVLAGEVVHIVQCVPVEVKIKQTEECYSRVPVLRGNETYFITPKTHIITNNAAQIPCNSPLQQYYQLGNIWYKFMPRPVETLPPTSLKPGTTVTWNYKNPTHLASSGIYTEKDLETMRNRIMFPVEQSAVLENAANKMNNGSHGNVPSVYNLLDEASLEKLAENTWEKTWGRFTKFGTVTAGFIGIFAIIKVIKLIIDTIVHGYALHTVYGWSIQLFGAIWSSITHLLLHLARNERRRNQRERVHLNEMDEEEGNVASAPLQPINEIYPQLKQTEENETKHQRTFVA